MVEEEGHFGAASRTGQPAGQGVRRQRDAGRAGEEALPPVESAERADAAICVFAPDAVADPYGTSLHHLGRFTCRA